MTFIDWSDAGGLFDLLLDLVVEEQAGCRVGGERKRFLSDLLTQLRTVEARFPEVPASVVIQELRAIHDSLDAEFANDSVTAHLRDCIDELDRIG